MATVLLIDDDAELTRLVGDYLTREGFTVATSSDGTKALGRIIETRADIVVLDVMMPGPDGLEVLRRIRAETAVPVLMLTARGMRRTASPALTLGPTTTLPNPALPGNWCRESAQSCAARNRAKALPPRCKMAPCSLTPSAGSLSGVASRCG